MLKNSFKMLKNSAEEAAFASPRDACTGWVETDVKGEMSPPAPAERMLPDTDMSGEACLRFTVQGWGEDLGLRG